MLQQWRRYGNARNEAILSDLFNILQRAYDQVVHDICRQNLNVFIGIDRSGLVGADGETHQGVFDISFLRHLPNMVLMMPKDENEGQHLVYTAMQYEDDQSHCVMRAVMDLAFIWMKN